uniref:Type III-B CRISPR module RAMP protein Cmr1 n=1 Tax=Thermorudis peleae TaxID=1382356 RepID=A0A831TE25_9BACT
MQQHARQGQRPLEVRIPLRTVTPLFLAGADPRGPAELRAASVRGALRFWLRALAGGCYGTGDAGLDRLRKLETSVFGAAGGENGVGASKVVVSLSGKAAEPREWRPFQRSRKQRGGVEVGAGIDYLYWSMAATSKEAARWCFAPGTVFDISLSPRYRRYDREHLGNRSDDEITDSDALDHVLRATWLLITLGSLGARQRRTAGSLEALIGKIERLPNLNFSLPSDVREAAVHIGAQLSQIRHGLDSQAEFQTTELPLFEVIHPAFCHIWVLGKWRSWQEAAEEMGNKLQSYRRRRPIHDRWIFGLPIPRVSVALRDGDEELKRRPAPL